MAADQNEIEVWVKKVEELQAENAALREILQNARQAIKGFGEALERVRDENIDLRQQLRRQLIGLPGSQ